VYFTRWLRAEWDRVAGYGCLAFGVVLLIAGFQGVRTSADVIDEIAYLVSGGIGAIFLLGVGATLLLSADLHDDFRNLHRIEEQLDTIERHLGAEPVDMSDDAGQGSGLVSADPVQRARRLAGIGIVAGAVLLVVGALRTANEPSTDHIAGAVGLALTGTLLVALVAALLVAGLRRSMEVNKAVVLGGWMTDGPARADDSASAIVLADQSVFFVDGLHRYHRAGCKALEGRTAEEVRLAQRPVDFEPCGLCDPQGPA
jgi:hypothetical protein